MNNKRFLKALGLIIVVALLAAALPLQVKAATLCVNPDGSGECYSSIQTAINAASDGDTINVAPGTYNIGLALPLTKPISIMGVGDATIINGGFLLTNTDTTQTGKYLFQNLNFAVSGSNIRVGETGNEFVDQLEVNNVTFSTNLDTTARAMGTGADSGNYQINNLKVVNSRFYSALAIYLTGDVGTMFIDNNDFHVTAVRWGGYNAININQYEPAATTSNPTGAYTITNNRIYVPDNTKPYETAITNQAVGSFVGQPGGKILTASGNKLYVGADITPVIDQSLFVNDVIAKTNANAKVHNVTKNTWYPTIQSAIDAASNGDTINVAPGTYTEQVNINKRVSIVGAGKDGANPTIITSTADRTVLLGASGTEASPILLKDLQIQGSSGIYTTFTPINYVTLDSVWLHANPVKIGEGFRLAIGHKMTHLTITNSIIEGYLDGIIVEKTPGTGVEGTKLQFVTMTNTIFKNNYRKGMYVETLSDATFTDVQLLNNGYVTPGSNLAEYHSAGFDINLKDGTYSNLQFNNMTATGNGLTSKEGAALMIKARDDGAYQANPATLNNVTITGGTFTGNERGIRFGEPGTTNAGPTGVVITGAAIHSNIKTYGSNDGSAYGDVVNFSQATVKASPNWWGSPEGPEPGSIGGSGVVYQPWLIFSDLVLDNSDIDENLPKDTVIGKFSPVDADPSDVFTYALVDTTHYPDNAKFKIEGDQLLSNEIFDFEAKDSYEIFVRATDPWGTVFEKPFTITINDVNEEPVLDPIDDEEVDEETPLNFDAKAEDEEVEVGAQTLTFSLVGAPTGASITSVGAFTWPISEEQGPGVYTFTVKVCDNGEPVLCDEEVVTITVKEVNANPVAVADFYGVITNTPRVVAAPGVLANDTDVDLPENTLTAVMQVAPSHGTLVLNSDGSFTYTPTTGYTGPDSFIYKVFDGKLYSDEQTVTLTISNSNILPTDIELSKSTIDENKDPGTVIGVLSTKEGTPPASTSDIFTYTLVAGEGDADNASFYIDGDELKSAEKFNYEVKNSYSVRIRATDSYGDSKDEAFTITVKNANDNPVLNPIGDKVVDEKTLLTFTATATDEDGDSLTFSAQHLPVDATFANIPGVGGIFSWTPTEDDEGVYDDVTIIVTDNGTPNYQDQETITITVNEVNSAPVANDQSVTLAEDKTGGIAITLTGSDADHNPPDTLTYSIVENPKKGALSGTLPNLTYTPMQNYNGPDSFTFKIYDGYVYSNIATVSITVTPVNDAPDSDDESYNVLKGQTLTVDAPGVLLNDTDVEEDTLTAVLTMNVSRGTLTLNPDGSFTYIPGAGDYITDTFKYKAFDGKAYSPEAVVTLTIINLNTPPYGLGLTDQSWPENEQYEGTLSASDTLGDVLTYSLVSGSGSFDNDAFEIEGTELKSKSEFNFEEKDAYYVRIRVTDQFGGYSEAPFIITVTDVNDAPVADDQDDVSTLMNTPVEITLTGSDEDGDELTYAIFSEPEHGTLKATELREINFAGEGVLRVVENKLTYTPDEGFAGEDSFTFKVMDEEGLISNLATVTIQVSDLPIAVDDAYEATEDEELSVDAEEGVLANDTIHDETVELIAALVDDVEHGTLELAADGSFTYLPEENFVGEDVFTYKACIEGGECSEEPATVTITVEPVNDEPNAVDDEYETPMGKKLEVPAPGVLENDIDPDQGDEQTVEVKDAPLHGVLVLNPDGSFTYEPAAGFHGIDTFTYWLTSEPGVQSAYLDWATVTITVRPQFTIFLPILVK